MTRSIRVLVSILALLKDRRVGVRMDVWWGTLIEAVVLIAAVASPFMMKMTIDSLSQTPAAPTVAMIYVSIFVLCWAATAVAETIRLAFTDRIVNSLNKYIAVQAVRHQIPKMAIDSSIAPGHVHGLLERLTFSLQTIIEGLIWKVLPVVIEVAVAIGLVASIMPLRYALLIAVVLVGFYIMSHLSSKASEDNADLTNEASGKFSSIVGDILSNAQRVMFNGAVQRESVGVEEVAHQRVAMGWKRSWLLARSALAQYGILALGVGALLLMGVVDVSTKEISLGDFVLLQAYVFQFALPLASFAFVFRESGVALGNVQEVLELMEVNQADSFSTKLSVSGAALVESEGLGFRRGQEFELGNLNFALPPGSFTALVGPNGAGKSTLMKLVAGLIYPTAGKVKVGGVNIHKVPMEERCKLALYVPQSITFFDRTLGENAQYFPCQLSEAEIVSRLVELEFEDSPIIDLNRAVGSAGDQLSGGQIQKIELARVSGVNVPLLVLDESTSGLDSKSELKAIELLLKRTACRPTLLLATHRLLSVESADQVIFMRSGQIVAIGSHDQLMHNVPEYRSFWLSNSE